MMDDVATESLMKLLIKHKSIHNYTNSIQHSETLKEKSLNRNAGKPSTPYSTLFIATVSWLDQLQDTLL